MEHYLININSKDYHLEVENYSILQLCEILHIGIPRFCYHEHLSIAGNCRMCLVELKNNLKPIVSCAYQISNNMIFFTNSQLVKHARENILEFLLINHPLDCPICDQGGECDLQDQTLVYGRDKSRFRESKRTVIEKNWGPFIKTVMTRCIHCTRCIRYFSEIVGVDKFGTIGRGMHTEIESYVDVVLDSEISGNVIDLCPVGALTSKPYSFTARPWELTHIESLDLLDSYCSYIRIDLRSQNILRILPVIKRVDYDYWITDKVRFSYDAYKRQRLKTPKMVLYSTKTIQHSWNNLVRYKDCSFGDIYKYILLNFYYCVKHFGYNNVYFFTGKFLDISSLLCIKNLTFSMNVSKFNIYNYFEIDFKNQYLVDNDLFKVEYENTFLLCGINTKIESAVLNIRIRKLALASDTNKFFYLGNHIEVNYPLTHVGLTMLELLDIYHGKHNICYYIVNFNTFNFMHGPDSYFDEYSYYISLHLSTKINKRIRYSYNNLFSRETSIYEYNACSRSDASLIDIEYSEPKFIYFINSDTVSYIKKNIGVFSIYQSHHFDDISCYANVLLPTGTHLDKKGYYINSEGNILYSGPVLISTEILKYTDVQLFYTFYRYLKSNKVVFSGYEYNRTIWNAELIYGALHSNLYLQSKVVDFISISDTNQLFISKLVANKKKVSKKIFIEDSFFITTERNFFSMDVFSRNSVYISNYLSYKQMKQINITQTFI